MKTKKVKEIKIPIEISARHIHLCREDLDVLFGKNYKLTRLKKLSQASDFAAEETVEIEANETTIKNVRVVGEIRPKTQLELTFSDSYKLKMDIPVRLSGDIALTPGFRIIGPAGVVVKKEGMIVAKRHLHLSPKEALELDIKDGDNLSVTSGDQRKTTYHEVLARVKEGFRLSCHIDTDEANAMGIKICSLGKLVK